MRGLSVKDITDLWSKYGRHPVRLLRTFLDNARVLRHNAIPRRGPLVLVFNASTVCDAKCSFCEYWRRPRSSDRQEATLKERAEIVRQAGEAGVWLLSFCAAEPFLMSDLEDLILVAKRGGMLVNISTNGSKLREKAGMLCEFGVDMVTISVDSHIASEHDSLRGYPGLYTRIEEGVHELLRMRKKRRPWISVRHLLTGKNAFGADELVKSWRKRSDDIIFKVISSTGDGMYKVPPGFEIDQNKAPEFREYFLGLLEKYPELDNEYHRRIPDHVAGTLSGEEYRCMAGIFFGDLDPEGGLYACIEQGEVLGNVIESGFMGAWTGDKMRKFRENLLMKKRCDRCWGDRFRQGLLVEKALKIIGGGV
ncbi:MAG: radical SAM protein [Candidatus Omnitrophica bacterium]|nr:radical SAM protein [Candidatus Omnitrophota bacterium]